MEIIIDSAKGIDCDDKTQENKYNKYELYIIWHFLMIFNKS
jgi:hypothetical protein